jgi:hypothetical protein
VVDTKLHKFKIASPLPFCFANTKQRGVRRTRNDVENVNVFCEGSTIWSRQVFKLVKNSERFGVWPEDNS